MLLALGDGSPQQHSASPPALVFRLRPMVVLASKRGAQCWFFLWFEPGASPGTRRGTPTCRRVWLLDPHERSHLLHGRCGCPRLSWQPALSWPACSCPMPRCPPLPHGPHKRWPRHIQREGSVAAEGASHAALHRPSSRSPRTPILHNECPRQCLCPPANTLQPPLWATCFASRPPGAQRAVRQACALVQCLATQT